MMTNTMHLWPEQPHERNGKILLSARLELDPGREETLWYEVPEQHRSALSDDADPFVLALVLRMAKERRSVRVHGQVSPSLLRNLEQYLSAWSIWKPRLYAAIEILAETEREREMPAGPAQAACGFSGGIDSSFTAFRHARGVTTRYPEPLTAGVMVHGFDIPLEEHGMYDRAVAKARRQLDSLNLELITLATSFRDLDVHWSDTFGPAVVSTMMLLGRRFHRGLIAQGVPYASYRVLVEGSNPLTDPLLSSTAFQAVPDGAAFSRAGKIRVLAKWPEAMELLRVCWAGEQKDRNCCECEKCIRNILTFRALGLGLPPCFERDVADRRIRELGPLSDTILSVGYTPIVQMAEERGIGNHTWVQALRKVIVRNRRAARIRQIPVLRRWPGVKRRVVRLLANR